MLVVDASVAVRWLFELDRSDRAERLLKGGARLIAPDFVLVEIANVAWKFAIFESFDQEAVQMRARAAPRHFDELVSPLELKDRALAIALELRHAAYDCFYLALAEQRQCRLLTADDRLVRRCAGTPFAKLVQVL